jgi:hypothetical protein
MTHAEAVNRDLAFGFQQEDNLLGIFRENFDRCLSRTGRSAVVDYIAPRTYLELKSRNCRSDRYNTIMFGKNKIEFAQRTNRDFYAVFNFIDGVYFYKYKKEDLDNGLITFGLGGRQDRGKDERKECAFIAHNLLTRLCDRPGGVQMRAGTCYL